MYFIIISQKQQRKAENLGPSVRIGESVNPGTASEFSKPALSDLSFDLIVMNENVVSYSKDGQPIRDKVSCSEPIRD